MPRAARHPKPPSLTDFTVYALRWESEQLSCVFEIYDYELE